MKCEKHIAPINFSENLTKSDVSENRSFLWSISTKWTFDQMYNFLKSLLATGYWSRDEGGIG